MARYIITVIDTEVKGENTQEIYTDIFLVGAVDGTETVVRTAAPERQTTMQGELYAHIEDTIEDIYHDRPDIRMAAAYATYLKRNGEKK